MREEQGDQEKYGEKTENNKNESDFMRNIAEKTLLLALLKKPKMCTFNTCEQLLMLNKKLKVWYSFLNIDTNKHPHNENLGICE